MLNRYPLAVLGVMFILSVLFLLHTSEEDRILDRLDTLRGLVEITAPETGIEPLARARRIGRFFTEQTRFDLRNAGYGIIETGSRDELVRRIIQGRARLAALEITLQDARVNIEDDRAVVRLLGSGLGTIKGEQEPFLEIHTVDVTLQKEAGAWLVTGARHVRDERQP